jgi:HPt (histidine-containing phosphotransfer) domain-containing protein
MIDWERVTELREEIGAEDFDEVAELFLAEVAEAIDRLEAGAGNAKIVEEEMHFLKGAALNLGFQAVSSLCQTGEKAAAQGDPHAVPDGEVRKVFDASQTEFVGELPKRFAA